MVETSQLKVGDVLPAFTTSPISRLTLALYCGASGDHNPMHVDSDYAKAGGSPDVFAHGMLSMGYLGRLLTHWLPQRQLREYGVRFVAITQVGEAITCSATVTELFEVRVGDHIERRARLRLQTINQHGQVKLTGDAVLALT
ncbi:MAG: MaoC family dehydratase [Microbacteriaceae bacterium]|nr:MaoC family dehydratase [Burkholderiaceae bacterium]